MPFSIARFAISRTNSLGSLDVAAVVLKPLSLRACTDERHALLVIDDLRVDVREAAIDVEARTLSRTCDMVADSQMTFLTSLVLIFSEALWSLLSFEQ
jgi:hypothetical protein